MKRTRFAFLIDLVHRDLVLGLALLPVYLLASLSARAQATAAGSTTNAPSLALESRAVFVNDPQKGKDPFFPDSQRRLLELLRANGTNAIPRSEGVLSELVLKGISLGNERLAVINNVTLAEGEKAQIRLPDKTAFVHCLEIRPSSVLVTLDGTKVVRELRLRKGI